MLSVFAAGSNIFKSSVFSLSVITLLSGCGFVESFDGGRCGEACETPSSSIAEIRALGVTITPTNEPFPDDLSISTSTRESDGEQFIGSDSLNLYFSPSMQLDTIVIQEEPIDHWAGHSYASTFSQQVGDDFEFIQPIVQDNRYDFFILQDAGLGESTVQTGVYDFYEGTHFGPVWLEPSQEELTVFGNHILYANPLIPIRATHVEIWFRENRDSEFEMMTRVSLESLTAWTNYLQPAIDGVFKMILIK